MSQDQRDFIRAEVAEGVGEAAREAARQARRTASTAVRGYFILLFILLVGAVAYQQHTDRIVRANAARIEAGLTASCRRVNVLRIREANRTAQITWIALSASAKRERGLARVGVDRQLHRRSAIIVQRMADALSWTPETNCSAAVADPLHYTPPSPVRFTSRYRSLSVIPGK